MIKLFKKIGDKTFYWETWENEKIHAVHWGQVGKKGETTEYRSYLSGIMPKKVRNLYRAKLDDGYKELEEDASDENFQVLLIEFKVDGFGSEADLQKRHDLEDRMNETLGWTGLGNCDGGSIGSGTMEVCCFAVDFEIAKKTIEEDLMDTEFSDYTRIYLEE